MSTPEALDPNTPAHRLRALCVSAPEDSFDVVLEQRCSSGIEQVKLIREYFALGLKEAMMYLDNLPAVLNQPRDPTERFTESVPQRHLGLPREEAQRLAHELRARGGVVSLGDRVRFHLAQSRLVAQNPGLPADLFALLSASADHETQRFLAQNPAAPRASLLRMAASFPREVLANPLLPLLLLEDPTLPTALPIALCLCAVRSAEVPRALTTSLLSSAQHRRYAAEDRETLPEWLRWLSDDAEWTVRLWVAKHANTPPDVRRRLLRDPHEEVRAEAERLQP